MVASESSEITPKTSEKVQYHCVQSRDLSIHPSRVLMIVSLALLGNIKSPDAYHSMIRLL